MTTEELKAIDKLTCAIRELDYTVTALLWSQLANNVGSSKEKALNYDKCLLNTQDLANRLLDGIREASKDVCYWNEKEK